MRCSRNQCDSWPKGNKNNIEVNGIVKNIRIEALLLQLLQNNRAYQNNSICTMTFRHCALCERWR